MSAAAYLTAAPRSCRAGRYRLRLLTAHEMLQAQAEAELCSRADDPVFGLRLNAAVLARALTRRGGRPFRTGEQVLRAMPAEEIEKHIKSYNLLGKSCELSDEMCEDWMAALKEDTFERLKWRVLRLFSALPTSKAARAMTNRDYLYCAMQAALDAREYREALCPSCRASLAARRCPGCGAEVSAETVNPAFDEAEFERKCGGC